jgi:enoyl-CoA hydratase
MIRACSVALEAWRDDPAVHAVVIEGAGDRAFCAGGDIRAVRAHAMAGEATAVEAFFAEEYALNQAIASYPKPYVALVDGICMGGGIGLSVHGAYRVASEHAVFAMPETGIGFFPDVGATYFLPRLPGRLGFYLGLTGARLQGADAVAAGLATHFVPREAIPALSDELAENGVTALAKRARQVPPASIDEYRPVIDRCFGEPSVPGIVTRLQATGGPWAEQTIGTLRAMSPSALFWSLEAIWRGARSTLPQALARELALTRSVCIHPDFHEGVRAMVVDKDRQPRWHPSRIEDVEPAAIGQMVAT